MNREEFLAQWFLAHESYVLNCSVEDAEDMALDAWDEYQERRRAELAADADFERFLELTHDSVTDEGAEVAA
jgi:hypothetical protein